MNFDLFDLLYPTFRFEKDKPIRLVELFSGIGFQRMGLELAEIPYEVVGTSEIDKFAIEAYKTIHGDNHNLGNIMDIKGEDMPKDIDIMTYSFPCTDLSKAGQQKGLDGTRSGLVYEVLRILHEMRERESLPKVLIMENVVDLIQARFIDEWNKIQYEIEQMGYTNYTQTLNARHYGIAQNRDRVFMVSILGEWNYNFPQPFELEYKLKDYLEDDVDERYYLSDKFLRYATDMTDRNGFVRGERFKPHDQSSEYGWTITTYAGQRPTDNFIEVPEATKRGYAKAYEGDGVDISYPNSETRRGRVQHQSIQTLKTSGNDVGVVVNAKRELTNAMIQSGKLEPYDMIRHSYTNDRMDNLERKESENGISATLTTRPDTLGVVIAKDSGYSKKSIEKIIANITDTETMGKTITANPQRATIDSATLVREELRIRKLTPTETGRLMGMNDNQIAKQREVMSNAQMYKQHGNGIVTQVIGLIIGMLYYENEKELRGVVLNNSHTWIEKREI